MNNKTVNMNLTPQEVLIIESLRACQSVNATVNTHGSWNVTTVNTTSVEPQKTEDQIKEELMEKYMNMNEVDFMNEYVEAVGADVILDVLCDTMPAHEKWDTIWESVAIDEDVIDELFASYVSDDTRHDMFFELNDREELAAQLVDLTVNG
jgi:hypothetical protein